MVDLSQLKDTFIPILIEWGLNIIWAVVILILGWAASKWFGSQTHKIVSRSKRISETFSPFIQKFVRAGVMIVALLMVLNQFGVQTASVIALLGTIGLAIGLALQGSLSNVASGMMILALRPFKVGDTVNINGRDAVIDEIGIFVTEMHTFDNIALIVTNTKVWNDVIENHSKNATRRVDMIFKVDFDEDLDRVFAIVNKILAEDERVLTEPEPFIAVKAATDSWIEIYVRPWAGSDNHFQVRVDLQKRIKERFDEEGIAIPFPRQVQYTIEETDEKPAEGSDSSSRQ